MNYFRILQNTHFIGCTKFPSTIIIVSLFWQSFFKEDFE
ncbi:uncharacterized protein METZ01_LOCUS408162 [marine metagenome]|uniref:Uncharacterized protein n=1 Tax=marine metagenome TaxID=408172 RepID=A0A382WB12_9ZZZZ